MRLACACYSVRSYDLQITGWYKWAYRSSSRKTLGSRKKCLLTDSEITSVFRNLETLCTLQNSYLCIFHGSVLKDKEGGVFLLLYPCKGTIKQLWNKRCRNGSMGSKAISPTYKNYFALKWKLVNSIKVNAYSCRRCNVKSIFCCQRRIYLKWAAEQESKEAPYRKRDAHNALQKVFLLWLPPNRIPNNSNVNNLARALLLLAWANFKAPPFHCLLALDGSSTFGHDLCQASLCVVFAWPDFLSVMPPELSRGPGRALKQTRRLLHKCT